MAKAHIYRLKIGRWRLYLADCLMRKMNPSTARRHQAFYAEAMHSHKRRGFKQNGGTCDLCGRKISMEDIQMHHILPFAEFPQYGMNPQNLELTCDECHHAIHMNPYVNLRRMEQKAREFGFDLQEYYSEKEKKQ